MNFKRKGRGDAEGRREICLASAMHPPSEAQRYDGRGEREVEKVFTAHPRNFLFGIYHLIFGFCQLSILVCGLGVKVEMTNLLFSPNVADFFEISKSSGTLSSEVNERGERSFHALPVGQSVPPEQRKPFELLSR